MRVSAAVCDEPFAVAVMVTAVTAATAFVLISNDACSAPVATVSVAGTDAMVGLLLESETTTPPAVAGD